MEEPMLISLKSISKLLINFTWWVNRKGKEGNNLWTAASLV
jgi:hypothetical protein